MGQCIEAKTPWNGRFVLSISPWQHAKPITNSLDSWFSSLSHRHGLIVSGVRQQGLAIMCHSLHKTQATRNRLNKYAADQREPAGI
jgi:hypothetical protein